MPKKIKVALIGDSIRMFYTQRVKELLGEDYEVFSPEDNCRFVHYTLRLLFELKDNIAGSDVIHWNNGLWDVSDLFGDGSFTPIDVYVADMVRVAKILKTYGKRVIFATTTPNREDYEYNDNATIRAYNAALVPELEKLGIEINDLYSLIAQDIDGYIREDDKLHINERGIEVCAAAVAKAIKNEKDR